MTDIAEQLQLSLPRKPQEVDIAAIRRQPTMTKAIVLCADLAGFVNDKDLCRALDIDPAVWTRIKGNQACFPQEKLNDLMDQAGNEVPLIWLADKRGYLLTPLETELQRQLRTERERADKAEEKYRVLAEVLQGRVA